MALFGTGPAKALEKWDLPRVCVRHGWHPAALDAIKRAESGGFGWFRDGRIKMLPEPHWFLRKLSKSDRSRAIRTRVATTTSFAKTKASGHYRRMKGASPRYALFEKWRAIDEEAAFQACSWGTYQIMGFNHKICGYPTAKAMVEDFLNGEKAQLEAFVRFLLAKGLKEPIRKLDFRRVALKYNGSGQVTHYSRIIRNWYNKLLRGTWKNWDPRKVPTETEVEQTDNIETNEAIKEMGFAIKSLLKVFAGDSAKKIFSTLITAVLGVKVGGDAGSFGDILTNLSNLNWVEILSGVWATVEGSRQVQKAVAPDEEDLRELEPVSMPVGGSLRPDNDGGRLTKAIEKISSGDAVTDSPGAVVTLLTHDPQDPNELAEIYMNIGAHYAKKAP